MKPPRTELASTGAGTDFSEKKRGFSSVSKTPMPFVSVVCLLEEKLIPPSPPEFQTI